MWDQLPPTCSSYAAMNTAWFTGSVAPKNEMKHPQIHYSRTLVLRILWLSFSQQRLRWYGHLQHATSCMKSVTDWAIPSTRQWGRPFDRLMAKHKTAVTPLLTHWSYWSLVPSDWNLVRKCEVWLEIVTCRALTRKTDTWRASVWCSLGSFSASCSEWAKDRKRTLVLLIPLNGTRTTPYWTWNGHDEDMNDWPVLILLQLSTWLDALPVLSLSVTDCLSACLSLMSCPQARISPLKLHPIN